MSSGMQACYRAPPDTDSSHRFLAELVGRRTLAYVCSRHLTCRSGRLPSHTKGGAPMRVLAILLGAVSGFFVFYTVRLLVVTRGLQHIRVGGQGAFIGAVVFPL